MLYIYMCVCVCVCVCVLLQSFFLVMALINSAILYPAATFAAPDCTNHKRGKVAFYRALSGMYKCMYFHLSVCSMFFSFSIDLLGVLASDTTTW